jgi:hypothetical protein
LAAPAEATPVQRRNFINVQIDAVGIGLSAAAAAFLPVFLTRLGATNFQVGLLTAMPSLTGLLFGVLVGRYLQGQRQIVPAFSRARFLVVSAYALTGLAPFVAPPAWVVPAVLVIWAAVTLPQVAVNVGFSVVMNAVAGPKLRYDLLSRRWSILGLTTALTVALAGQVLDRAQNFPLNYQVTFLALSVGGLISLIFSGRIEIPDQPPAPPLVPGALGERGAAGGPWPDRLRQAITMVRSYPDYVTFVGKRFVFFLGFSLSVPLFPLYFVREAQATDTWIGAISTAQTFVLVVGYSLWSRASRVRGGHFVLAWTTLGLALYPALVAGTHDVRVIAALAGLAGIFQAGLDLVFFDELMKTVPPDRTAVFVSLAQSLQYLSGVAAPLIGTALADALGLGGALLVSAALRLVGWSLFAFWPARK